MIVPGRNSVRAVLYLGLAAIPAAIIPELLALVVTGLLFVIVLAVYEAAELRAIDLRAVRPEKTAMPLGEETTYTIDVSTSAAFTIDLDLRQTWPALVDQPSSARRAVCRPGEIVRFDFPLRAIARGFAELAPAFARVTRRAFAERIVGIGAPASIAVTPNTAAVGRLHQQLNQFFLRGYGSRTATRLGKGREFDRMRDYVRGDELRDVAWRTTARHGRLIVREYRLDRSQDVLLCVDTGHRMAARVGRISRLDHAVNAAMLVSYVCNRMEDRVGVLSFSHDVGRSLPPGRGKNHLREITKFATDVQPFYRHTDFVGLAGDLRRRLRHRTLIFLMTVLPEVEDHHELLRAVRMLSSQHLVLITVFTDRELAAVAERLPSGKGELSRMLVARELIDGRAALTRQLRGFGALVVETPPEKFGMDSVNAYLDVKRRQLL